MIYRNRGETDSTRMSDSERKELEKVKRERDIIRKSKLRKNLKHLGKNINLYQKQEIFEFRVLMLNTIFS